MTENTNEIKEKVKARTQVSFADAPHWLSMIFSIAALIVSGFSWRESYESRKISQSANRALVHVVALKPIKQPNSETEYMLVVKNFGKSIALQVGFSYGVSTVDFSDSSEKSGVSAIMGWDQWDLPPDLEREDSVGFLAKDLSPNTQVYLKGVMFYKDEATGKDFEQRWCFTFSKSQEDHIRTCPP